MPFWTRWRKSRTLPGRRRTAVRPVRRPLGLLELLERRDVPHNLFLAINTATPIYGDTVQFTATLTGAQIGAVEANGSVTLLDFDLNVSLGSAPLVASGDQGTAVFHITSKTSLSAGSHNFYAMFHDDFHSDLFPDEFTSVPSLTVNVARRSLTIGATAQDKVYDGTTAASVALSDNSLPGDSVTASFTSASFNTRNAGTGKAVTVTGISISGADAANYVLSQTSAVTTAAITARPLNVTAAAQDKVYDGTTAASATLSDDHIAGDAVTTSFASAAFGDKSAGTDKTVTVSGITISGTGAGNYTLAGTTATTTASITARDLTVTATAQNRVYDGTPAATVTLSDNRVAGDVLTDNFTTAAFADKSVGTGKTVTVSGIGISGPDAANYALGNTATTASADITRRGLTVGAVGGSRVYDGTTSAVGAFTLTDDRAAGDSLAVTFTSATFPDKAVGTGRPVSISGITVSGADVGNYDLLNTTASTAAAITARTLTVTATAENKSYDGTANAAVTLADNRIAGDVLSDSFASAAFADKNVGTAKSVTVSGIAISGTDAGNYALDNTSATATADITRRGLTVSAAGGSRAYDGTANAAGAFTLADDRVAGDALAVGFTAATFPDKAVGTGRPVSISGIAVSGADAGNYNLLNTTASTNATITARALTVTAAAQDKVYDGTTAATVTLSDNRVAGDSVTGTFASAAFADKAVGSGKTVTVSGIAISGADAGNYALQNTAATAAASITARALTVTATAQDRVYDGTTAASVALADNHIAGDSVADSFASAAFADKAVGAAKAVAVSGISISGADAGNYTLANTTATAIASITARTLTVTATAPNKVYDGTTGASAALADNRIAGDSVTTSFTGATFSDPNAGTGKTVTVSGIAITGGGDAGNYALGNTTATATADITKREFTIGGFSALSKTYDGTTAATITGTPTLVNVLPPDVAGFSFSVGGTGTFADKNAGTGKPVAYSYSLSQVSPGAQQNYTFTGAPALAADITRRGLTVSATGGSRVYDGTTAATVTFSDNRVSGDALSVSGTASFADKAVGTSKPVTVSGISVSGADAGNYSLLNTTATAAATITARTLTVTATAQDKVYDGTPGASATLSDNRISGDTLTTTFASAAFASKSVGTGKTVTVSGIAVSGADAGNYTLGNTTATTTASITARTLTVTAAAQDKTYDGTPAATVTLSDNRVAGDSVTDSFAAAAFASKSVGTGKTVTVSGISIGGADAGNYTLGNATALATASITARTLTVTAAAQDKVYDGTTAASVTLSDNRVAGDVLTDSFTTAAFANKAVGTGKAVTVSGIAISGTDAANYALQNTTATATANITARTLTVTATAQDKVYDGTPTATVTLSDNRAAGDVLTDSFASAAFASKSVGTGKPVTVSGIAISGIDAANYTLASTTATAAADITARALTVSATAQNRVYDGTPAATVTLSDNRVAGDVLTDSFTTAAFANKAVGTGKAVTVSGIAISGTDAANYALQNTTATATASITARTLTVMATAQDKTYDGTAGATVTLSDNRVAGDSVTDSFTSATFASKSVGTGKAVTVSGISIGGADAGNYALGNTSATATASITARTLTVTASAQDKVYDGTTAATVTLSDNRVAGDALTTGFAGAAFADRNAGAGKTVTVSGIAITGGSDAGNYTLGNTSATATASITARALTVTAAAQDKVYDGTTAATVTLSDNRVAGDSVTGTFASAAFADKAVGSGKTVTVSGIAISGADAGNYALQNTAATAAASITARALTVTATAQDKVYDGTPAASVTLSDNRIAGDAVTATFATAAFSDKSAGTGKSVTVGGIGIGGPDAGNYALASTTATAAADITARTLTVTAAAQDKVYDGTTAATVTLSDNRVAGDSVTESSASAAFASKSVGTGKTVTVSGISIGGADAGNYALAGTTATATASITARALTVSAAGVNRVYDGTTAASVTLSDNRVAGDALTDSFTTATFTDKNVGAGKLVAVGGIAIGGADAGNYALQNTTATAAANITARTLTVTATAQDKVYDGTTAATVTLSDNRISGDALTVGFAGAAFADKNAGAGKTVTVSGIAITGGADDGNYTLASTTATATANITGVQVTPGFTAADKVYDGTTAATITGRSLSGLLPADVGGVTLTGGTANFADKNVGTGKTVTATGFTLAGTAAGNYTLSGTPPTATASIAKATLLVTADSVARQYSDPNPSFTASVTGFVNGETLATSGVTGTGFAGATATPASPPGQYVISAGVGSLAANNYAFRPQDGVLFVLPEDARTSYTGATYVATNSASDRAAAVTLSARVEDASLFDAKDTTPGDVRTAVVAFINRDTREVLADNVPITLVNPADARLGTASATVSLPVNTPTSPAYAIDVRVKGNYAARPLANGGVALVEVASQAAHTVSGGGTLTNLNTAGQLAGDAGLATNFAFSAQTGASPAGGVTLLVRKGGGAGSNLYEIKGTSLTALSTDAHSAVVLIAGAIRDVSDPAHPQVVDGGVTIRLSAQDNGAGGSADTVAVTVRKSNGDVWFNSSFSAASVNAVAQLLALGDVAVVTPQRLAGPPAAAGAAPDLTEAQLQPIIAAAVERWRAAGVSAERLQAALGGLAFRIDDLPGSDLGSAGDGQIRLDRDAAGHGWFVDPTPFDDAELAPGAVGGPAAGRVDLLTVVAHELGHALGLDSDGSGGLMGEFLALGVRRLPTGAAAGAAVPIAGAAPAPASAPVVRGGAAARQAWPAGALADPVAGVLPAKRSRLYAALLADAAADEFGRPG